MPLRGNLDALAASLGLNGVDYITSSTAETPPNGTDTWYAIVPAGGTTPLINRSGCEVANGDKPVNGQEVPSQGLYFPFEKIDLSQGEVYALRA